MRRERVTDLGAAVVGEYLRFRRAGHDDLDWEA